MKKARSGNRWKIIIIVTAFNLLAEYSLRGINDLRLHPQLFPILVLTYFSYFTMIEDLITRFRLRLNQLFTIALFYGILWQMLFPLGVMAPPLILGINWGAFLFVNIFLWCATQTILGFYIATRFVPRDWNHPLLSKKGFIANLLVFCLATLAIRLSVLGLANPIGMVILALLAIATYKRFRKSLTAENTVSSSPPAYNKNLFLDALSVGLVLLLAVMAFLLPPDVATFEGVHIFNKTAVRIVVVSSVFVSAAMLAYRRISKKPFSV